MENKEAEISFIMYDVQRGALTPDEATKKAMGLISQIKKEVLKESNAEKD